MNRLATWQLFALCVLVWGTTWYAITWQIAELAPEFGVALRFALAGATILAFAAWRGERLRFGAREHARFALQGAFMYGVSYVCVYHAEQHVVSGLVAVGYSASPLLNMVGMRLFFGTPMTARVGGGALLGIAGITLVFWPEFSHLNTDRHVALGAFFTAASVVLSALSNMAAHRNHDAGLPVWQTMAWGMLYGAIFTLAITLALGRPLGFEATPGYVLSLLYLAVFGSVLAFGGFLTLLARIGAARAGYIGVMVPIVALAISSVFEGYRWEWLAIAGIAISVAGNVIILGKAPARA